jgi:predicted nuclease of predicted toxin-antitoxin system
VDVQLRFYTDTHIAKAVAEQLRAKGIDIIRCEEVGMASASDEAHLEYATREGRVLVSQDEDFIRIDAQWRQTSRQHAGIMRVPPDLQGTAQISYLVTELLFYYNAVEADAVDYATEIFGTIIYL